MKTGFSAVADEISAQESEYGPRRAWLKPGTTAKLIFIDDSPVVIREHNPKLNGTWQNAMTCLDGTADDVACCQLLNPQDYKAYLIGFFTVINCAEWVDKKGKKHQYELELYAVKMRGLRLLQQRLLDPERGSFAGKVVSVSRADAKSASSGEGLEVLRDANMEEAYQQVMYRGQPIRELFDSANKGTEAERAKQLEKLKNIWQVEVVDNKIVPKLVPFNYRKLLYPMTPKEVRALLGSSKIDTNKPYGASETVEPQMSDVPF
jgi:hypothetical protein